MVTLDGSPLAAGTILFQPSGVPGAATPAGSVIAGGAYSISRDAGPIPGRYRVAISSPEEGTPRSGKVIPADEGGPPVKDRVPARYNTATKLEAEVTDGGKNEFNFDLKTRP